MGKKPFCDCTFTPTFGKISSKKCIGLFTKLPLPSILIKSLLNAAIGVNIRIPNPLSPQFIEGPIGFTPLEHTITLPKFPFSFLGFSVSTIAPNF